MSRTARFQMLTRAPLVIVLALLAGSAAAQPFERVVEPFPVRDLSGERLDVPFFGGLNQPRVQFVDIDADGDLDLFVQDTGSQVAFFENVGTPQGAQFVWRADAFGGLDVGEWFRFGDLDGDGDADLLAEQPFSLVRYYENVGTPMAPRFTLAADTLRAVTGRAERDTLLVLDRQNVPALADLNCDGWLDLFETDADAGTLVYFEGGPPRDGRPFFRFISDRFQNIEVRGEGGRAATRRHGASAITLADYDGDGDVDLFWGDFFEPSVLLFENVGACEAPDLVPTPVRFPPGAPLQTSGYNAPRLADIDADGDLDLFVGALGGAVGAGADTAENLYFYEQTPTGYMLRTRQYLSMLDVGDGSTLGVGDLTGDGRPDLVIGQKAAPADASTAQLALACSDPSAAPGARYALCADDLLARVRTPAGDAAPVRGLSLAPAVGDLTGDDRPDLVVGDFYGALRFLERTATDTVGFIDRGPLPLDSAVVRSLSTPTLGDLTGDGLLDLVVGQNAGTLAYYRNTGSATAPSFTLVSEALAGFDAGQRSAPALHDIDGDGDLDLFVGASAAGVQLLRNVGTAQAPRFVLDPEDALPSPRSGSPAFADLDGDGDGDYLSGGLGGGLVFYRNGRIGTGVPGGPQAEPLLAVGTYPSPAREEVWLAFDLAAPLSVEVVLVDLLGREVGRVDARLGAGPQALRLPLDALPAGVYAYRLAAGTRTATGTIVRVR